MLVKEAPGDKQATIGLPICHTICVLWDSPFCFWLKLLMEKPVIPMRTINWIWDRARWFNVWFTLQAWVLYLRSAVQETGIKGRDK